MSLPGHEVVVTTVNLPFLSGPGGVCTGECRTLSTNKNYNTENLLF